MSYDPDSWISVRAHLGHLAVKGAPEAEIAEARRDFRALRLADHIRKMPTDGLPFTTEQRERLAGLLAGGGAQ